MEVEVADMQGQVGPAEMMNDESDQEDQEDRYQEPEQPPEEARHAASYAHERPNYPQTVRLCGKIGDTSQVSAFRGAPSPMLQADQGIDQHQPGSPSL